MHRRPASDQLQIPPASAAPPLGSMWGTTRARSTRSRRAAAAALPEELVVWDILIRLPAKALLRCRAVCRSWRRLTSDADFLLAHHERQPSLPLVVFKGQIRVSGNVVAGASLDAFDPRGIPAAAKRRPVLRFNDSRYCSEFKVYASCDGLLLCLLYKRGFYICNPATCQWIALPMKPVGVNVSAALYRHSSSGEYRVLYRNWTGSDLNFAYYILTVGSYAEPRCVGMPTAAASAFVKMYIASGLLFVTERPPVLLHSCLHWIVYSSKENALVVFDTVAESFRCMCPPSAENGPAQHLLEMDGTLGINYIDGKKMMVKLWVLQDYEMEVWSLKYQIELPMTELRNIDKNCIFNKIQVVLGNGDVLVCCSSLCHLYHWDGKLLQKFRWHRVFSRPIGHWFKESLVRHAFFQRQGNDHVVKPPLFQWS